MTREASLETFTGEIPRESLTDEELKETLTGEETLAVEKQRQSLTVEEQNVKVITAERRKYSTWEKTREKLEGEEEQMEMLAENILHNLKKQFLFIFIF